MAKITSHVPESAEIDDKQSFPSQLTRLLRLHKQCSLYFQMSLNQPHEQVFSYDRTCSSTVSSCSFDGAKYILKEAAPTGKLWAETEVCACCSCFILTEENSWGDADGFSTGEKYLLTSTKDILFGSV